MVVTLEDLLLCLDLERMIMRENGLRLRDMSEWQV